MHVQVFGIGGGEQFLDGLFERPTIVCTENFIRVDAAPESPKLAE